MKNDISVEYAHIYTNNHINEEHVLSLEALGKVKIEHPDKQLSLVVMVDDYSFPDPSFDYEAFDNWLKAEGYEPHVVIRESQLIPVCDAVLKLLQNETLKNQISDYVRAKKYPCSLFVAAWYLLRLGKISHPLLDLKFTASKLINILPISFKPFEDKAFEIIASTQFKDEILNIENKYFEGRLVA